MGSYDGEQDEQPLHRVYVDSFYIDKYPVTNADYKKFVDATGHGLPYNWVGGGFPPGTASHPVRLVSWDDAAVYSRWAGKRLPTEAEWEKAARGGLINKKYPWGDDVKSGNARYSSRLGPVAVGQYAPNGYGVFDMAGNVWEWVSDWYDPEYYYYSSYRNPQGPSQGLYHALRGGSWYDHPSYLRCAFRNWGKPDELSLTVGFRCAKSLPGASPPSTDAEALPVTHFKVGDQAPDFTLPDENGVPVRFTDLWHKKNTVLIFFGPAFTGGAKRELEAYEGDHVFFGQADSEILAVSEDDAPAVKKFKEETGVRFTLLCDRRAEVARLYEVFLARWDTARRSTFVVDKNGIIQYVKQAASNADSEQALDFCLKAFVHGELPVAAKSR